jgi:hypothetical protein
MVRMRKQAIAMITASRMSPPVIAAGTQYLLKLVVAELNFVHGSRAEDLQIGHMRVISRSGTKATLC